MAGLFNLQVLGFCMQFGLVFFLLAFGTFF